MSLAHAPSVLYRELKHSTPVFSNSIANEILTTAGMVLRGIVQRGVGADDERKWEVLAGARLQGRRRLRAAVCESRRLQHFRVVRRINPLLVSDMFS